MVIEGGCRPTSIRQSNSRRTTAGTNVPAGTLALVRSPLALRCSKKASALHTLIRQRHLTPSCGGHAPTAERTLNSARTFLESLDHRPGIREQPGSSPDMECALRITPLNELVGRSLCGIFLPAPPQRVSGNAFNFLRAVPKVPS